jgi:hypothetical protein
VVELEGHLCAPEQRLMCGSCRTPVEGRGTNSIPMLCVDAESIERLSGGDMSEWGGPVRGSGSLVRLVLHP